MAKLLRLNPQDYTVAWLCALPKSELVAATLMLDERHEDLQLSQQDRNIYTYGSINGHNVVLACLPPGQPGKLSGLKLVQPLSQSFPNLKIHLFVGIGGGVPRDPPPEDPQRDIHLGDVAIGWAEKTGDPGVVQWDYVRYHGQDKVQSLGSLNKPERQLVAALGSMLRDREMGEKPFHAHLTGLNHKTSKFAHPGQENDKLFQWTYEHVDNGTNPVPCNQCQPSQLVKRSQRTTQEPVFHQGTIASGDSVMQNAEKRDIVSRQFHNAICFEMEAAGVTDETRCLVIRGICDYSDSHKNSLWQDYAAATAAAFAKQFLFTIQPSKLAGIDHIAVSQTIQALSPPLQAINQALPLIQQQTENTAISIRAVHNEARDSRQDARDFREKALQEMINLATRVDSSPSSLERTITMTLDRHSAAMNQLQHDLYFAQSKSTGDVVAKLEAIDQSIKGLQIGLISKPGLMQSVCEENDRLEKFSRPNNERRAGSLGPTDGKKKRCQRCSCGLKHNITWSKKFSKSSRFGMASSPTWKFMFETESMSHHPTCHLFATSSSSNVAKFRMKRYGAFLAGAIEASISIVRGAGGLSISPGLQYARVVTRDSPAFKLIDSLEPYQPRPMIKDIGELEASLDNRIHELVLLFRDGKASPYDVDLEGNTLLHAVSQLLSWWLSFEETATGPCLESIVKIHKRLQEVCVPLNWTNDLNLTFMNHFVLELPAATSPCDVLTSTTRLLDIGAEFAKFSIGQPHRTTPLPIWMTQYTSLAEFVDALEDNELSLAIWHRSERELDETLRELPHLINQTNGLGNTPLHLAVGWPCGVRKLLQHGSCVDAIDQDGYSPLCYAIDLGNSGTVSLLMKADCGLERGRRRDDLLNRVSGLVRADRLKIFGISQEVRTDVLDAFIASLAERRRNLQSRLAALSTACKINTGVFRDDRILDEYAEYAEGAEKDTLKVYDHMPRHASSLLRNCRTVYHCTYLNVEIAEKLWQNGFHDIDVHDKNCLTPLMCFSPDLMLEDFCSEITLCSWLIGRGAKLHRPQHGIFDYDPGRTPNPIELPTTQALHYVAAKIGYRFNFWGRPRSGRVIKKPLLDSLDQLSEDARLLPMTILLDVSCDDCVCACSSQGCLASTMMYKVFRRRFPSDDTAREWFTLATEYLLRLAGSHNLCPDWLVKEIIRYGTFKELELRHTCCQWDLFAGGLITKLEPEEQAEIRDEDHEKIELLESLLQEFEEDRGTQDVLSFLEGYWGTRMNQVRQEQGCIDEDALRKLGIVLYPDERRSDVDELHEEDTEGSDSDE